jgi:hypothetical protein
VSESAVVVCSQCEISHIGSASQTAVHLRNQWPICQREYRLRVSGVTSGTSEGCDLRVYNPDF